MQNEGAVLSRAIRQALGCFLRSGKENFAKSQYSRLAVHYVLPRRFIALQLSSWPSPNQARGWTFIKEGGHAKESEAHALALDRDKHRASTMLSRVRLPATGSDLVS